MLLTNEGIRIGRLYVPPFTLRSGEFLVVNLMGGAHFYETALFLKELFTGRRSDAAVKVWQPFDYAERYREPLFRRWWRPVTVGSYFQQHARPGSDYPDRFYATGFVDRRTKVNTLAGDRRKLMELSAALSHAACIAFDLAGIDPAGADKACALVKDFVSRGGAAILLDWTGDMREAGSMYVEVTKIKD